MIGSGRYSGGVPSGVVTPAHRAWSEITVRPRRTFPLAASVASTRVLPSSIVSDDDPEAEGRRVRQDPTEFVRSHYDRTAGRYDRKIRIPELLLFADGRAWAAGQAGGDVLEVAVGSGRNLPYYRPGVHVVGVDVSASMVALARARRPPSGVTTELRVDDAQQLDMADGTFDTVVATLALCSIPDDSRAVREMARVLRPGGRLLLLEHVRSPVKIVRAAQRILEPAFLRLEGDHLLRQPEVRVTEAGLRIDHTHRSKLGLVLRLDAHKPG